MEELLLLLWFALWLVGPCVLQLGVLRLTRRSLGCLRLLPLAAVGGPLVCARRAYRAGGLFVGLNVAAALLYLLQAGLYLAGWGLAWVLWRAGLGKAGIKCYNSPILT